MPLTKSPDSVEVGAKFSRLTVVRLLSASNVWECLCDCGKTVTVFSSKLRLGNNKSCGCLRRQKALESHLKHGHSPGGKKATRAYRSWQSMKARCLNSSHKDYEIYGGRGIQVCTEWIESFEAFIRDMGTPGEKMTLDRINNEKGYCKENCRWATAVEQANNRRDNSIVETVNRSFTATQFAKEIGVHPITVRRQLLSGKRNFGEIKVLSYRPRKPVVGRQNVEATRLQH